MLEHAESRSKPSLAWTTLAWKTIVVHTVTYFVCGVVAYLCLDYERRFAEPELRGLMRQTDEAIVMAGPLFQPLRGILFAIAFYPLRDVLFGRPRGWLVMWGLLTILGIFSTFGPAPGSIEGMIYTTIPIPSQLVGLSEVLAQSLLLSVLLCRWVNHPERRWLGRLLTLCFVLVVCLSTLGLIFGPSSPRQPFDATENESQPGKLEYAYVKSIASISGPTIPRNELSCLRQSLFVLERG